MNTRGLEGFAREHSKTFARRVRRGIPAKYRWEAWLLLTNLKTFLAKDTCGTLISELFSTPVIKKDSGDQSDQYCPTEAEFPELIKRWTEQYKIELIKESYDLCPKAYYEKLASKPSLFHSLIEIDISRTFPEIASFNNAIQRSLLNVLVSLAGPLNSPQNAYANFAPHIGYCQGMNFICGFIFLVCVESGSAWEPHEVFYMLALMMSRYNLHGFYREGFPLLEVYVRCYEEECSAYSPSLMNHFTKENVLAPVYIHQWYLTLFVTSLPRGATVVIWDYILASDLNSLIPVTLGLLSVLQTFLLRLRFEGIVRFLKSLKNSGNCDEYRIGRMLVKQADEHKKKISLNLLQNINWPGLLYQHTYQKQGSHPMINQADDISLETSDVNPFEVIAKQTDQQDSDADDDSQPPSRKPNNSKVKNFFSRHH